WGKHGCWRGEHRRRVRLRAQRARTLEYPDDAASIGGGARGEDNRGASRFNAHSLRRNGNLVWAAVTRKAPGEGDAHTCGEPQGGGGLGDHLIASVALGRPIAPGCNRCARAFSPWRVVAGVRPFGRQSVPGDAYRTERNLGFSTEGRSSLHAEV